MTLVLLLMLQGRTSGGHGLLEATPRIYQVTPDIPDRRRATKQKEVRPSPADSLKESQLAARSGPSPPRRTTPTSPMRTASPKAVVIPRRIATTAAPLERAHANRSRLQLASELSVSATRGARVAPIG